jgi:hypothetical protein
LQYSRQSRGGPDAALWPAGMQRRSEVGV